MKKNKGITIISLVITVIVLLILTVAYEIYIHNIYRYEYYSSLVEIQIPIFTKIEEKDTHGGFNGDGATLSKIYFSDKQASDIIEKIEQNEHWNKLPLPEQAEQYINNYMDEKLNIPTITNGYYFFLNRYNQYTNKYDYTELAEKPSYNYTIALFNTDANILYIYSLDT